VERCLSHGRGQKARGGALSWSSSFFVGDLVSDNKAVSPPELSANQIQDHSQLRGENASEYEDDDEGRGRRKAPLNAYFDVHSRPTVSRTHLRACARIPVKRRSPEQARSHDH
jgi:hypothetical protein